MNTSVSPDHLVTSMDALERLYHRSRAVLRAGVGRA
jgi:hypothetical protein